MTSIELKEKYEKALEKVEKCKQTIERHQKNAEKRLKSIQDKGWSLDRYEYTKSNNNEAYWAICEYENKVEAIENAKDKLSEAELVAENWKKRYETQLEREETLAKEVPEAFKQARAELIESWVANDIKCRDIMLEKKKELSWEDFRKMYRYSEEQDLTHSDEEFRKIEEVEADRWLLNLYERVKAITGEVTDCSHIHWGGKCLDGYVVGANGTAEVKTIDAGGYNIQRWHLRVLVQRRK